MRVLLIYPPISKIERYSSEIGHAGGRQIPLGIYYLASAIRDAGHRVRVIDGEASDMTASQIARAAADFETEVVGISTTTVAFHRALEVAKALRAESDGVPIILGGPHIAAAPVAAMSFEEFDIGVIGEGEITLQRILKAIENGDPLDSIPGTVQRTSGVPKVTPGPIPRPDVDTLPFPAYDLIETFSLYNPPPCNYKRLPAVNVITSRGCPSQCTFCDRSVFGQKLRVRSAANIAAEIEMLHRKFNAREIAFVDDNFTFHTERIYKLFDLLDDKGIRFPWTCMSRINTVNYDFLKFIRDKGCWHISFGIESGDPEILRRIRKRISLKRVQQVVQWCRQLGILTKGFFILGHPGETLDSIDKTIATALRLPLDDVVVTLNTPLPGTVQYEEAEKYGTLHRADWSCFNMWTPVFEPTGLSAQVLEAKHREFYRRFYFRPRIMVRYAASFLSASGLRRAKALISSLPYVLKPKKSASKGNRYGG